MPRGPLGPVAPSEEFVPLRVRVRAKNDFADEVVFARLRFRWRSMYRFTQKSAGTTAPWGRWAKVRDMNPGEPTAVTTMIKGYTEEFDMLQTKDMANSRSR